MSLTSVQSIERAPRREAHAKPSWPGPARNSGGECVGDGEDSGTKSSLNQMVEAAVDQCLQNIE